MPAWPVSYIVRDDLRHRPSPATRWICRPSPTRWPSPSRTACSRTTASFSTRPSRAILSTMISSPAKAPFCHPTYFPGGGPTALAEFFGDHMVVNGMIWPKDGRRAAQLPPAPAQRLRQPLPGRAVLRGAGWRHRLCELPPGRCLSPSSAATRVWLPARRRSTRC